MRTHSTTLLASPKPLHWKRLLELLCAISLMLVTCSLAACSPPSLNVLCSNEEGVCEAWVRAFERETGVQTRFVRLPTAQALARVRVGGAREFDIWVGGPAENYEVASHENLLARADSTESIPARFKTSHWVGIYASMLTVCYNPQVLARNHLPTPTSWVDLEDPKFAGWISAPSPLASGTGYRALLAISASFEGRAKPHLNRIYDNVGRWTNSGTSPASVAALGEAAVAISFSPYCREASTPEQPLLQRVPAEGTTFEVGGGAVLEGARNAQHARAFLRWLTSEQGQRIVISAGQTPVREGYPASLSKVLETAHYRVYDISPNRASRERDGWLSWFELERLGG